MKYSSFILFLLVACAQLKPQPKVTNALRYVNPDPAAQEKLKSILNLMTNEEKKILTNGYLKFYRYAFKDSCNIEGSLEPGPGLPRFKIPPLIFLDLNRQRQTSASQTGASFLDLSTESEGQKYYYIKEAEKADEAFFNEKSQPEPVNKSGFNLLLLRSGDSKNQKFMLCALHYTRENLCVEDFITPSLIDINDPQQVCLWLKSTAGFEGELLNEVSLKLLQALEAIRIIPLNKLD